METPRLLMMPIISWQCQLSRTHNAHSLFMRPHLPSPARPHASLTHNKLNMGVQKGEGEWGRVCKVANVVECKMCFHFCTFIKRLCGVWGRRSGIRRLLSATRRHGQLQYDQRQQIADNNSDNNSSNTNGNNNVPQANARRAY